MNHWISPLFLWISRAASCLVNGRWQVNVHNFAELVVAPTLIRQRLHYLLQFPVLDNSRQNKRQIHRQTDRQTDRQMDGWTEKRIEGWTDEQTDKWMDKRTDGRTDGWTDRRFSGRRRERLVVSPAGGQIPCPYTHRSHLSLCCPGLS